MDLPVEAVGPGLGDQGWGQGILVGADSNL